MGDITIHIVFLVCQCNDQWEWFFFVQCST